MFYDVDAGKYDCAIYNNDPIDSTWEFHYNVADATYIVNGRRPHTETKSNNKLQLTKAQLGTDFYAPDKKVFTLVPSGTYLINAGTTANAPSDDFLQKPRGTSPSIGAYEY